MIHRILSALHYIHERWFMHRDLKTSNILVGRCSNGNGPCTGGGCRIALCDFGLARKYEMKPRTRNMTQNVVTLWYRAPELLFGEKKYGPEVDMWR